MSLLPLPFPADTISLDYGATTYPYDPTDPHNGIDFSSRSNGVVAGTVILASGEGVVVRSRFESDTDWPTISKPNRNAGNSIDVDYPDLNVRVRYMHRPVGSVSPRAGDHVVLGTVLGVIGATGLVTAAHLHMEAWDRKTGRRVSPWLYFSHTLTVADALAQPAGDASKPIIIPTVSEEDDMRVLYMRAKGDASVYAFDTVTGKRRGVSGPEWKATEAAYKAAGQPIPYAKEVITLDELRKIPIG